MTNSHPSVDQPRIVDSEPFGIYTWRVSDTTDAWIVALPHECGEWPIAGDVNYRAGIPFDDAVSKLQRFIAEAQAALDALRIRQEFGR
jgi:hypothetical protein